MAYDQSTGTANIRETAYSKIVKGFADRVYKFKQALTVVSSSAWTNYYYRENPAALTEASGQNAVKGVPRLAQFPSLSDTWEQTSSILEKFGAEDNLAWEDLVSGQINIKERSMYKIAEAVANAVDGAIWNALTENRSVVNIQSVTCFAGWQQSSAAILLDLEKAEQKIAEYYYPTSDLLVFVSPIDKRSIFKWLTDKGAQFPSVSEGLLGERNGVIGKLGNKTFVVSPNVTASYALVVVPKRVGNWREVQPLTTTTKEDPYKSLTIRAAEVGVTEVTDPKCAVLLVGTQTGFTTADA